MESAFQGTIYEPYDFSGPHTHVLVVHVNPVPEQSPALAGQRRSTDEMQQLSQESASYFRDAIPDDVVIHLLADANFLVMALGYTLPHDFSADQETVLMENLTDQLSYALRSIRDKLALILNLSVSALHPNTQNVYDAVREALAIAVHFPFLPDPSQIMLYSNFRTGLSAVAVEEKKQLEQRWNASITAKNYVEAEQILLQILNLRASAPLTMTSLIQELEARMRCAVYRLCDESSVLPDMIDHLLNTVEDIHSAKTMAELHQRIHSIFLEMEHTRETAARTTALNWPSRIIAFVQNNYADPTLNVTSLSRRFAINSTYLSHIFRESTGIRLLDYIHSVRIDHVKQLLRDTKMSLTDIASKTGYFDRYSMSRVFERYTGIAPSIYRRNACYEGEKSS